MPKLDRRSAQSAVNEYAAKDLGRLLLVGLALGAGGRSIAGLYGNAKRNVEREKRRNSLSSNEVPVSIPVTKQSNQESLKRPWWFAPALTVGAFPAVLGGWAGVGALMKKYRQAKSDEELAAAKQEFETALAEEQASSKFACDLNELAQEYVSGNLDESLEKEAFGSFKDVSRGAANTYMSLAGLLSLIGAYGGWKMMGKSDESRRVEAYREAARRRNAGKPLTLVAQPKPVERHHL